MLVETCCVEGWRAISITVGTAGGGTVLREEERTPFWDDNAVYWSVISQSRYSLRVACWSSGLSALGILRLGKPYIDWIWIARIHMKTQWHRSVILDSYGNMWGAEFSEVQWPASVGNHERPFLRHSGLFSSLHMCAVARTHPCSYTKASITSYRHNAIQTHTILKRKKETPGRVVHISNPIYLGGRSRGPWVWRLKLQTKPCKIKIIKRNEFFDELHVMEFSSSCDYSHQLLLGKSPFSMFMQLFSSF